jgi:hypothetical protein
VCVAFFSDNYDGGGPAKLGSHESPYLERMAASGSEMLDELLRSHAAQVRSVHREAALKLVRL